MRRREFITLLGGAGAWSLAAQAQQPAKAPRIGMLYPGPQAAVAVRIESMLKGVRESGNLSPAQIELVLRVANGDPRQIAPMVAEIVKSNVDGIFANGPAVLQAFRSENTTIPVVAMDLESDPVENATVASLAHPGGTVTGLFLAFPDFTSKWLELLKEAIPQLSRVAVLWDPTTGSMQKTAIERAAKPLNLALEILEVRTPTDFAGAFVLASKRGAGALLMLSSPLFGSSVQTVAELALRQNLPAVTLFPDFARAGGLMAYGPNLLDMYRQSGVMIGKVLQGKKLADLPIERPTQFEFVVNLKTAKTLGVTIPDLYPVARRRGDRVTILFCCAALVR
jgi:putative tryptophan/tyrosine transport system substrate-binding protein